MLVVGPAATKRYSLGIQPGHHRPAVIDHAAVQQRLDRLVDFQVIALGRAGLLDEGVDHPFVGGVAPGDHHAGQQHRVADLQARGWLHR